MRKRQLMIKQLGRQFRELEVLRAHSRPAEGWIRIIRKTLGMTIKQLAGRMDVDPSRITRIEADEMADALTIRTLKHAAEAMGCELHYVIMPKMPINDMLQQQAQRIAKKKIDDIHHTMVLEDQGIDEIMLAELLEDFVADLLKGNPKYLWDDIK